MTHDAGQTILEGNFDLARLVEHGEAVQAGHSFEAVYDAFRTHKYEFVAVVEGRRYVGMVSRGHVGFLCQRVAVSSPSRPAYASPMQVETSRAVSTHE